jgi:hypothetical protein
LRDGLIVILGERKIRQEGSEGERDFGIDKVGHEKEIGLAALGHIVKEAMNVVVGVGRVCDEDIIGRHLLQSLHLIEVFFSREKSMTIRSGGKSHRL